MLNFYPVVTVCSGQSRQFTAGFRQHGAALALVDRVFDSIDPDGIRLKQFLGIVRSKCLRMLAQRLQAHRLEGGEIGFADRSDRNFVGQMLLLPTLLSGGERMSTLREDGRPHIIPTVAGTRSRS